MSASYHPGCTNKMRYSSWRKASAFASGYYRDEEAGTYRIYGCAHCGGYHITMMDTATYSRIQGSRPKLHIRYIAEEVFV